MLQEASGAWSLAVLSLAIAVENLSHLKLQLHTSYLSVITLICILGKPSPSKTRRSL